MGCHNNISYERFPEQGKLFMQQVRVFFHYGNVEIKAACVRDDFEPPWLTIFKLPDGRHVLATECQYTYSFPKETS